MNTKQLQFLADIQTGPFGSQLHKEDYVEIGTPIVTVEHLGNRIFTEQNLPRVSDDDKARLEKYVLQHGDIVFSRVGSVDRCSFVDEEHDGWLFSGRCLRVRPNEQIDAMYLYYYFCMEETKQFVRNIAVGATMPSINTKLMGEVPITYPSLMEQKRTAKILAAIDDRIENNTKINDNLLDLATALFNQTITENNATLVIKIVSEIADVKGGKRLPKGINLQTTPNNHPYIRVRDLNDACIVQLTPNFEYVDDETQKGISRYIVHTSDVIVSIVGTIGLTALIHESLDNANLTENCVKITNLKEVSPEYLLLFLRSVDGQNAICQGTVGAVQAKLPIKNIQSIPVPIIPEPQKNQLNDQLHTIFLSIAANLSENSHLIQIRDSLLPRLMSGDIDVSEVSI